MNTLLVHDMMTNKASRVGPSAHVSAPACRVRATILFAKIGFEVIRIRHAPSSFAGLLLGVLLCFAGRSVARWVERVLDRILNE